MKKIYLLWLTLLQLSVVIGCSKPDTVTKLESPDPQVFYTVETYYGHGAASSDFTWVYAHLERNGKTDRKLVLDGEYLVVAKAAWANPKEVTLCISEGLTNLYRNEVTLSTDGWSETIHTHLEENCR